MSAFDPSTDLTLPQVQRLALQYLCLTPGDLAIFDLPPASYFVDDQGIWTQATLRPWVEARARARVLSIPGELDILARMANVLLRMGKRTPLHHERAREFVLEKYAQSVVTAMFAQRKP